MCFEGIFNAHTNFVENFERFRNSGENGLKCEISDQNPHILETVRDSSKRTSHILLWMRIFVDRYTKVEVGSLFLVVTNNCSNSIYPIA